MAHGPLQRLQWAGCPKVLASSHSWDSLLHWAVACEMMSSDWQLEQTGVERAAARRLTIRVGSWLILNGLRSEAWVISVICHWRCTKSKPLRFKISEVKTSRVPPPQTSLSLTVRLAPQY